MKTLLPFYFLLKNLFAGCHEEIKYTGFHRDHVHKIERVFNIDTLVKESSGLAYEDGVFWTLGDSGTKPELYGLDSTGKCIDSITHPALKNVDWEELAIDRQKKTFFIADVGNNGNRRKDLAIYTIGKTGDVKKIPVSYALQKEFPPNKKLRNYDCEAMVFSNDSLFLFSKNRGLPLINWYGLPAEGIQIPLIPGKQTFLKGMITGAAFHEASGQLVLLAYGKLYWFKVEHGNILQAKPWLIRKIPFHGQTEALCFDDKGMLYFSNEKGKCWKVIEKNKNKY
ncbi:MAG TPA: hypothetical protein VK750_10135 [Cytophagaceae bacterium]|jgi:hypothetical protein|nr:hypothetical protein [Cytophagaceae bacterium]